MAETRYCWYCYARQPQGATPDARCVHCGNSTAAPKDTTWPEKLLWSLSHPLVERRIVAAHSLAELGERRAVQPLRAMAVDPDPYLAAAGVCALAAFDEPDVDALLRSVAARDALTRRRANTRSSP